MNIVRTPDSRFETLPDFPFEPHYAEVPTLPAPFWLRNSALATPDVSFDPLIEGLHERAANPTERVAVLHEGAWMDIDGDGTDRSGNPDFLTLDEPSPAGAFAYNTVLANVRKSELVHRPGWDQLATARSHVFRRDQ